MLKTNNRPKFKKGGKVRIYRYKTIFKKGYAKNGLMSSLLYIKLTVLFHRYIKLMI